MDVLRALVSSLEEKEKKEFSNFIQRQKVKKNRKDLRLFNYLMEENSGDSKSVLEYLQVSNLNAYHTIRKRLYLELSEFILFKSLEEDGSKSSRANGYYNLSKHLFQRGLHDLAWKTLMKAEKLAVSNELIEILHSVYLLQIENAELCLKVKLEDVLVRFSSNKKKLEIREKVLVSKAEIRQEVMASRAKGEPVDLVPLINQSVELNELEIHLVNSPTLMLDYLETLKDAVHVSKSYLSIETVIETYFIKVKSQKNTIVNSKILFMLAHIKYRNKKFEESLELLSQGDELVLQSGKIFRKSVRLKHIQLKAANLVLVGEIDMAVELLTPELQNGDNSIKDKTTLIVSLGIYHFLKNENDMSQMLLNQLVHTEKWYEKNFGKEWLLKKKLMEILLFYELGKIDLVHSRIRSLERRFKFILSLEVYSKAKSFLTLLKYMMLFSNDLSSQELRRKIENSWEWLPAEEEDLQAMMFYAWLKSKVVKKTFYQTLLDTVNLEE